MQVSFLTIFPIHSSFQANRDSAMLGAYISYTL